MQHDLIGYLDQAIETLESLLKRQIAECRSTTSQPCSVSGFGESLPSGLARLQALRRTRRVIARRRPLERPDACRQQAARYAIGGPDWCAVRGNDGYSHLRREGFTLAATDLDAIVLLAAYQGKSDPHGV